MSILIRILLIACAVCFQLAPGARILAVFPIPFRDHQWIFRPLIENLVERGHHLTVLTTDPRSFDNENTELIDLSFVNNLKVLYDLNENDLSGMDMLRTVFRVIRTIAEAELKSGQVQQLLRNESVYFDAVIVDWSGPALMNGFAYYFKAPLIGITPGGAYITSHEAIGNPNHPIAFPSILMPFSEDLNIFQRIASTFFTIKYRYLYFNEEIPLQHEISKDYFGVDIPSPWDIDNNVDLLLVNAYQALGNSRPIGPTTIYLGGIHKIKPKPLPRELGNFLNESFKPVVYINLGIYNELFIKTDRIRKLLNVLENSEVDIVWNTNNFLVDVNTTARIYYTSIDVQEDVLRHANIRLFITAGGQRDIEDAIHHSVPVLGLTFSSNLDHYLLQIAKFQAGLITNFDMDMETVLQIKIHDLLSSERYKENIHRLNTIVNDQPHGALERAVWWIEYVIRHSGTKHLSHSLNKLSWFQYLMLDVLCAVVLTITAVISVLIVIVVKIRRYSKSLPFEKETRRAKAKLL